MDTTLFGPLTKQQLKDIRRLGRVHFYHRPDRGCIVTVEETNERDSEGHTIEIRKPELLVASRVRELGGSGRAPPLAEVAHCGHSIHTLDGGDRAKSWRTIVKILKPGDQLELVWGRGYDNNQICEKAGVFADRLTLHVHRRRGTLTFIIPTPVCRDDTARTIKRGQFNNL